LPVRPAILSLLFGLVLGRVTAASPPATQPFDTGMELLRAGRYDDARGQFEAAAQTDHKDSEARFFLGVALNRLARPAEALEQLEIARKMGNDNPDLPFETGWAEVMLHDWARAVGQLQDYERGHPGRGQTSEFLGRAYLGLKQYSDARKAFDRAVALDPDLKPTVDLYRAELAQAAGNPGESVLAPRLTLIAPAASAAPVSALPERYGLLSPTPEVLNQPLALAQPAAASAAGPWRLEASVGTGYDSNARGLEADTETSINVPPANGAASVFAQATVDASWHLVNTPAQRTWAGIDVFERAYARQEIHSDFLEPALFLESEHEIARSLLASLRVSDTYTLVDYTSFRNQVGASAAIDWDATSALRLEGSYAYAHNLYLFPFPRPEITTPGTSVETPGNYLDEDAEAHTLTAVVYWTPPGTQLKLRGGYSHTWNFAQGSDFDFHADGLLTGLTAPIPWGITAEIGYAFTVEHYTHINEATMHVTPPRPARRHDSIDNLTVRFTRPLGTRLTAYLEFDYNLDASNLGFYHYQQSVIGTGVIWRF
jgi:hypothetical protein